MRILLADDHDLVRDTIAAFLTHEAPAEVATAATLDEALDISAENGPFDLVLLDYAMPGMDGLSGLERMLEAAPGVPVAILSGIAANAVAEQAVASGAAGFVPKTLPSSEMVSAAKHMAEGKVFMPVEIMNLADGDGLPHLSKRESQVLSGICEGKSNKEIARDCNLQEVTIKLHARTLCRKLGARNRTHAAMIARNFNLV